MTLCISIPEARIKSAFNKGVTDFAQGIMKNPYKFPSNSHKAYIEGYDFARNQKQ